MEASEKKIQLHIDNMSCVNCQNKIEERLNKEGGIISARVSYNKGVADIVYDARRITIEEIIKIIEALDYDARIDASGRKPDITRVICMLIIIVCLYVMLQMTGILNLLVPGELADSQMGYGMLFIIGLITSVHCIAMCGGINLSQCLPGREARDGTSVWYPALAYNAGRVIAYTAIGFILGCIGLIMGTGAEVGLSAMLQGLIKMIAGLFMIVMGINMLGIFPGLRRFTIRMPGGLAGKIRKKKARSSRPLIVGLLNGFMPCGPLQSMWLVALASGSPAAGAFSMLVFSLGTVPLMLGFGSVVSLLGKKFTDKVMTIGALLVVVLGLAMLSQGGSLSGWLPSDLLMVLTAACCAAAVLLSIPIRQKLLKGGIWVVCLILIMGSYAGWNLISNPAQTDGETRLVDGVQEVNSTLMAGQYPNITVQAGIAVKWIIQAPEGSINGCNYKLLIQDYGIEYTFHVGENIIEFTPEKTGTIRYSCWMGMIHGNIVVTDENGAVNPQLNNQKEE